VSLSGPQPGAEGVAVPPAAIDAGADDATLVAAARANPEVFKLLYRRYVNAVYRYCYVRLGSPEAAEDVTSEVFLRALAGLPGYRGGVFAGWLFRIAQREVSDARRHASRQRAQLPLDAADEVADPADAPDELVISRSESSALRAALRALPADQRAAVELQLAGWSSEQISAALKRSPGAVRVLRFRAVARLRAILGSPSTYTTAADAGVNDEVPPARGGAAW
jgi:RNA polymerase sigma-70 factor (ECF subfamily)